MSKYKLVFVTGATGLLGREVVFELIDKGHGVIALRREHSQIDHFSDAVTWVEGDLADLDTYQSAIIKADAVIHCAAKVSFNPKRAREIIQFNSQTTEELVNCCLEHQKPLIHVSSVAALGSISSLEINEESAFDLQGENTAYAKSKYFGEMEVWRGISEGLEAVIVNPSIILGIPSRWSKSSGIFWVQVNKGLSYYPKGSTGYVDARDVAMVMVKLLHNPQWGQRYIINAENKSYHGFFTEIANQINKKPPTKRISPLLSQLLLYGSRFVSLFGMTTGLSKPILQTMNSNKEFSNQKVRQDLQVEFRPLEETIHWVSQQYIEDN